MKAKVIETGEIVDVECAGIDELMYVIYKEISSSTSARTFKQHQLDFGYNNPPVDKIDWEQRRYELTKTIMPVMITSYNWANENNLASTCIKFADAVIAKLKEE